MVKSCAGCVDVSTCMKDQRAKSTGCKFRLEMNGHLTEKEVAPLNKCTTCKDMICIKDGKICKAVEKLLPKPRSGGHRKEFPTDNIEQVYYNFKSRENGWRVEPVIYEN